MAARYDAIGRTYAATPYLDANVREGISVFHRADPAGVDAGLERLRADLDSGEWAHRHADLLDLGELDLGYRLLVAEN